MTIQVIRDLIAETEGELAATEQQVDRLKQELDAFRSALRRRSTITVEAALVEDAGPEGEWQLLPRSEAVARALAALTSNREPTAPASIHRYLSEQGRDGDDRDSVSASLAHLQRSGRAHRVGHKMWLPGVRPSKPEGSTAVTVEPSSSTTGTEGGADHAQGDDHRRDNSDGFHGDHHRDRAPVGALT